MEIAIISVSVVLFVALFLKIRAMGKELEMRRIEATKEYEELRGMMRELHGEFQALQDEFKALKGKYEAAASAAEEAEKARAESERMFQEGLNSIINYSSQKKE